MKTSFNQKKLEERFDKESLLWRERYTSSSKSKFKYDDKQYRKRFVLEMLGEESNIVLDLGCGAGMFFKPLNLLGFSVVGVDYSMKMLELASSKTHENGNTVIVCADALRLPFKSDVFNGLICVGLLEYFPEDETLLNQILHMVKPGGRIVITLRNRRCFERRLWKLYNKLKINIGETDYFYREVDPRNFRSMILSKGFSDYQQRFCHFYPFPWPFSKFLKPINNFLAHYMEKIFSKSKIDFLGSTMISSFKTPEKKD